MGKGNGSTRTSTATSPSGAGGPRLPEGPYEVKYASLAVQAIRRGAVEIRKGVFELTIDDDAPMATVQVSVVDAGKKEPFYRIQPGRHDALVQRTKAYKDMALASDIHYMQADGAFEAAIEYARRINSRRR